MNEYILVLYTLNFNSIYVKERNDTQKNPLWHQFVPY